MSQRALNVGTVIIAIVLVVLGQALGWSDRSWWRDGSLICLGIIIGVLWCTGAARLIARREEARSGSSR